MTTNISFFELVDGVLQPCEDRGHTYLARPPADAFPRIPIPPPLWRTKNELRRLARAGTRGRRGARNYRTIRRKYTPPEPVFVRIPSPIEMVANPFGIERQYEQIGVPEDLWPKEQWIVVIYARRGSTIPQQIVDQAKAVLSAHAQGRTRSIEEMIKAIEDRNRQAQQARDWERKQAWIANGRYR